MRYIIISIITTLDYDILCDRVLRGNGDKDKEEDDRRERHCAATWLASKFEKATCANVDS